MENLWTEKLRPEEVRQRNKRFLKLQEDWKKDKNNKKAWDEMYMIAIKCMYSMLKKRAGGLRKDLEELSIDGANKIMGRIKDGTFYHHVNKYTGEDSYTPIEEDYWVKSLPTTAYYVTLKLLYNLEQQAIDKEENIEDYYKTIDAEA